ncbi:MAG TPA: aminotransferase class V-fold PLP-dependent enzyme, partial [Intrasporangiaceae bacterium]|nr:aminotransferase class V-fold PLP-dependent enzyme [Intrasporangiaceae bacterium]
MLDAAQGPLHPAARETLLAALDAGWADPRRLYASARQSRALLDQAREIIAGGLGVRPSELTFHGSGAQALSVALDGLLHARRRRGRMLVASAVEHSVVLTLGRARAAADPDQALVEVPVDEFGRVDLRSWDESVSGSGVAAAVLQHANGEVGTIQPLPEAYAVARRAGTPLLCDAQASLGRVDPPRDADVVVGSAASFGGPPAVGFLVVREGTRFALPGRRREAEHGLADADPWVPLVLAAAEAWRQTEAARQEEAREAYRLIDRLRTDLAEIDGLQVVGHPTERLPHIVTASALYVDGETIVHELARRGTAVASGSACTASTLEPSHVLAAMGALSHGNIRVTLPLGAVSPDRASACAELPGQVRDIVTSARAGVWDERPAPDGAGSQGAVVDSRGTLCPQPIIDVARWWREHPDAAVVTLLADDAAALVDVPAWCRMTGRELRQVREQEDGGTAYE